MFTKTQWTPGQEVSLVCVALCCLAPRWPVGCVHSWLEKLHPWEVDAACSSASMWLSLQSHAGRLLLLFLPSLLLSWTPCPPMSTCLHFFCSLVPSPVCLVVCVCSLSFSLWSFSQYEAKLLLPECHPSFLTFPYLHVMACRLYPSVVGAALLLFSKLLLHSSSILTL